MSSAADDPELPTLLLRPIGFVRTDRRAKFDAPHQPEANRAERNRIELLPERRFELALDDLAGFDRIWLISWFDRNQHWRPHVLPPRGPARRRGVLATRSPHRPNPIGLTCVPLLSVSGTVLEVGPLDLTDGTPILDIKPYLPSVDAFPESATGWVGEMEAMPESAFRIEITPRAEEELDWLRQNFGVDFTERAFALLRRDPTPHRTRRILRMGDRYRMACGPWRVFFRIDGDTVTIEEIQKGYSEESLQSPGFEKIPDREAQLAFALWQPRHGQIPEG